MDVVIVNTDGVIVEEGAAVISGKKWKYSVNSAVQGSSVFVTATNRLGKTITMKVTDIQCI
jgi:hypothetical protein